MMNSDILLVLLAVAFVAVFMIRPALIYQIFSFTIGGALVCGLFYLHIALGIIGLYFAVLFTAAYFEA